MFEDPYNITLADAQDHVRDHMDEERIDYVVWLTFQPEQLSVVDNGV